MLALYRSGRQAEALSAYREARRGLVERLGIEPGSDLQDLERAILRHDPSLVPASTRASSSTVPDRDLPESEGRASRVVAIDSAQRDVASGEGPPAFVGRETETRRLKSALQQALDGRGRTVLLVGEPGIGKTRTAFELAAHAERVGARVYWGRCYERAGTPPYWPWVHAVRGYVRDCEPERLRVELGVGGPDIAEVISDVRDRLPDLGPRPVIEDPRQARFRLFDSPAAFLRSASAAQPLVLVLDDLHWADTDSLALLEFVAGELADARVLLVGIYRDVELSRHHPLVATLAALTGKDMAERIVLRGLEADEVERFLAAVSGVEPPFELVEAVHAQTEGNPLFVTEVVRLLAQEGELTPEKLRAGRQWSIGIPAGVRNVIGARLERLSEQCNDVLTVAAVVGRDFSFREVDRLVDDVSAERLLELLEEALGAHVIEELPGALDNYQFTHALIQEVRAHELSTSRRVRLHARIAEALAELYADELEAHAAELAHHFAEAEAVLGSDGLVRYSLLAGEQALAAHAYEEAIAQFTRALAAKEGQPTDAETADLLFGLARSGFAGRERPELREALGHLKRAFDYYSTVGDAQRAVSVAAHPIPPMYGPTGVPELMSEALALAPAASLDEGRLLSTLGWFSGINDADYERSREAFDRSLVIAQRLHEPALETRALVNPAAVDGFHMKWQDCLEESARAIELALAAGDERTEMIARGWAARVSAVTGDLTGGRAHAAAALDLAEKLRERYWLATAHAHNQWLAVLAGDVQAARAASDAGLALQPEDARNLGSRALLEYQLGEFTDGNAYLDRLVDAEDSLDPAGAAPILAAVIPAVCRISGETVRRDTAVDAAENLLASESVTPIFVLHARIGLALVAVQRNDAEQAREQYAALESQRDTAFYIAGIAADRLLGLLAAVLGERDRALIHYQDALAFCQRAGYRPEYAWTASDYAEALQDGGLRDIRESRSLHDEALSIGRELGMRPLTERVVARQQRLTG